jgi:hypothetical protein
MPLDALAQDEPTTLIVIADNLTQYEIPFGSAQRPNCEELSRPETAPYSRNGVAAAGGETSFKRTQPLIGVSAPANAEDNRRG